MLNSRHTILSHDGYLIYKMHVTPMHESGDYWGEGHRSPLARTFWARTESELSWLMTGSKEFNITAPGAS